MCDECGSVCVGAEQKNTYALLPQFFFWRQNELVGEGTEKLKKKRLSYSKKRNRPLFRDVCCLQWLNVSFPWETEIFFGNVIGISFHVVH